MTRIGTITRLSLSRRQGRITPGAAPTATSMEIVSGQAQSATVSQQLPAALVVRVLDQFGSPFAGRAVSATVNSGGGAITPSGAVTNASGLATFTATVGAVAGFNSFTVASTGLVGSPLVFTATGVAVGSLFPNEPAGWALVSDATWEASALGPFASGTRDGYSIKFVDATRSAAIETISDSIVGEARALTHIYPPNHTGGGGGEPYLDIGGSYRSLYVGAYVKLSANWFGHGPSGINKLWYVRTDDGGFSAMWTEYRASGATQPLEPIFVNQFIGGSGILVPSLTTGYAQRGQWALVETILELNGTPRARYWVDGVLFIDQSFSISTAARIAEVTLSGIMGGIGPSGNPSEQRMQYDRVRIRGN